MSSTWTTRTRSLQLYAALRSNSTTSSLKQAVADTVKGGSWSDRIKRFATAVKIVRFPFLIAALYTLGYQQGVIDTIRNPLKLQDRTLEKICNEMNVTTPPVTLTAAEASKYNKKDLDPRALQVAQVGEKIVYAARDFVRSELATALLAVSERRGEDKKKNQTEEEKEAYLRKVIDAESDKDVKFWMAAYERMEGHQNTTNTMGHWKYTLIDSPVPNAFVSELLPHHLFVSTALLATTGTKGNAATTPTDQDRPQLISNQDELAMVLGHEMSHLVLGHNSEANVVEFAFRGLEVVLLLLDPTEGLLSLGMASFLASARQGLMAAHSRENESQADELGCELASKACFDTRKGCRIFWKLHELESAQQRSSFFGKMTSGNSSSSNFLASHPTSKARFERLKEMSRHENLEKYSTCDNLRRRLGRVLSSATTSDTAASAGQPGISSAHVGATSSSSKAATLVSFAVTGA